MKTNPFYLAAILVSVLVQNRLAAQPDTPMLPAARVSASFAWGVNGHPLNQEAYWGNIDSQITILKKTRLNYYRVDVPHDENGVMDSIARIRFTELQHKAAANDITLVPIIFPPTPSLLFELDTTAAYEKGLAVGEGFARNYGRYFHYYELGNENDGDVFKMPAGDGSDTAQYDLAKLKILASALRGMSNGIRTVDPKAKIIISNAGWMHYQYFWLLELEGVSFDIIGYHWYEDVGHLRKVLHILRREFGDMPVWFTEINGRNKGMDYTPAYQERRVKRYVKVIRRFGRNVDGIFIYELFDQPASPDIKERSYGLVSWDKPYSSFSYKPLALFLQSFKR